MNDPDLQARFREVMLELAGDDGDLGYMHDSLPALTAFVAEYATPDFECAMCGLPPTPPVVWRGVEGIAKAWEDYGGSFEGVRAKLVEIRESETHTAVIVDQLATTRHGGVTLTQPSAMVFAFKDERVERVEFHLDRAAALRSAGVEGRGPAVAAADASRTTGPAEWVVSVRTAFVSEGGGDRMMGDADVFVDTLAPHATDDFSSVMEGGALTARYEGLDGLRAGWQDFLEAFDEIEIIPGELRESPSGDAVVEFVRLVGKPRGVSAAIDQDAAAVWRLRDGKLSAVEFHLDRPAALRAGGLDPADPGPPVAGI